MRAQQEDLGIYVRQQISTLWPMPLYTFEGHVRARSKRRIGAKTVTGKKSFAGKAHDHVTIDTHHATPRPTSVVGL